MAPGRVVGLPIPPTTEGTYAELQGPTQWSGFPQTRERCSLSSTEWVFVVELGVDARWALGPGSSSLGPRSDTGSPLPRTKF